MRKVKAMNSCYSLIFALLVVAEHSANPLVQVPVVQPQEIAQIGLGGISQGLQGLSNSFSRFSDQLSPYIKKEYLIPAGALATLAIGTAVWYRRDIYWAFRNDLPQDLAKRRVYRGVKGIFHDPQKAELLAQFIFDERPFRDLEGQQTQTLNKNHIDSFLNRHAAPYTFNRHPIKRSPDWYYEETENCNIPIAIFRHKEVARQSSLNCGYHAFHNAIHMLRALKLHRFMAERDNPELYYEQYQELINGPDLDELRSITQCHTNIDQVNVRQLIDSDNLVNEEERENITIIFSILQATGALDSNFANVVRAFQKGIKRVHAFILCDARDNNKVGGTGGHWVAIVVERVGNGYCFHTADSLGGDCRSYIPFVAKLLSEDPNWLEQVGFISEKIASARSVLNENADISSSLGHLVELQSLFCGDKQSLLTRFRREYANELAELFSALRKADNNSEYEDAITSLESGLLDEEDDE